LPAFVSIRNGPFRDVSRAFVRRWAERMLSCLDLAEAELSVVVTDDREIRELNKVFRHRDRPTDVLAFAMREGEPLGGAAAARGSREMLGDVVISVETARRQARQRRRPLDAEVRMLLAHGVLHLVGYDHRSTREETVMTAETERLCRAAHPEVTRRAARGQSSASKGVRAPKSRAGSKSKKTRPKNARQR
jgi:probable rRNA maturation factor